MRLGRGVIDCMHADIRVLIVHVSRSSSCRAPPLENEFV